MLFRPSIWLPVYPIVHIHPQQKEYLPTVQSSLTKNHQQYKYPKIFSASNMWIFDRVNQTGHHFYLPRYLVCNISKNVLYLQVWICKHNVGVQLYLTDMNPYVMLFFFFFCNISLCWLSVECISQLCYVVVKL